MVTVEITESTAMHDPDRTLGVLNDMHDRGLKLAIDDFGTGYSSLSRLRHMPVDVLKIDRSFVRNVDADHDAASMVSAMIALASNLGMTALAEGIETVGEWDFLRDRGCALGQGFYFAKPMAGDLIMALHRRSTLRVISGEAS
jgi:EAL domain-containing protein (putative c-di-GMP-specific phosphodiesterase class I)